MRGCCGAKRRGSTRCAVWAYLLILSARNSHSFQGYLYHQHLLPTLTLYGFVRCRFSGPWLLGASLRNAKSACSMVAIGEEPVLVFISEHADVPILKPHEEMRVEVTVPAKGPPRPIRLGIKKDGVLTPLQLK
jgi:hypothetical protein